MKNKILGVVSDLVADFLYYDRKEDYDLGLGEIEQSIKDGIITQDDIIEQFAKELKENS